MDFVFFDEFLLKDLLIAHDLNGPHHALMAQARCFHSQVCIQQKPFLPVQSESFLLGDRRGFRERNETSYILGWKQFTLLRIPEKFYPRAFNNNKVGWWFSYTRPLPFRGPSIISGVDAHNGSLKGNEWEEIFSDLKGDRREPSWSFLWRVGSVVYFKEWNHNSSPLSNCRTISMT